MTFKVKVELSIEPSESPFYLPRERELEYYLDTLKETYEKLKEEYEKIKNGKQEESEDVPNQSDNTIQTD